MTKFFITLCVAALATVSLTITGPQLEYIYGAEGSYRSEKPNIDSLNFNAYFIDRALEYGDMYNSCPRQAAFVAQVLINSCTFKCLGSGEWEGKEYEGRADVGNTQPGDGVKYRPRGAFKIVGRNAYKKYGQQLGVDFENHPEWVEQAHWAYMVAAAVWKERGNNELADKNNGEDIERAFISDGLPISQGPGFIQTMKNNVKRHWSRAKEALGC